MTERVGERQGLFLPGEEYQKVLQEYCDAFRVVLDSAVLGVSGIAVSVAGVLGMASGYGQEGPEGLYRAMVATGNGTAISSTLVTLWALAQVWKTGIVEE